MVKLQTLCHVFKGNNLLLKQATRGINIGKWNAPGGNIDAGETPEQCAIREVKEETGLRVSNLFHHGTLNFYFGGKENLDVTVDLYSTSTFEGRIKSTVEGPVKWFDRSKIPLDQMWEDDLYWLELMYKNRKFNAHFYFNTNNKIAKYSIFFTD